MKIKTDINIPKNLAYLIPSDLEIMMNMYQVDTMSKLELTETSMSKFIDWIKENHPEYLKKFGKIEFEG